jgi:hypothetical protein
MRIVCRQAGGGSATRYPLQPYEFRDDAAFESRVDRHRAISPSPRAGPQIAGRARQTGGFWTVRLQRGGHRRGLELAPVALAVDEQRGGEHRSACQGARCPS